MEEKAAREAFRVRQYSALDATPSERNETAARELEPSFILNTSRCIVHFDVDAFYAQVPSAASGLWDHSLSHSFMGIP